MSQNFHNLTEFVGIKSQSYSATTVSGRKHKTSEISIFLIKFNKAYKSRSKISCVNYNVPSTDFEESAENSDDVLEVPTDISAILTAVENRNLDEIRRRYLNYLFLIYVCIISVN